MAAPMLSFTKMEGAGNDYVYVDAFHHAFDMDKGPAIARMVADRRFGVGGDGLIILAPSERASVAMVMWNADGSRSAMCGNGIRCLAKLAHDVGVVPGPVVSIETDAGVREVELVFTDGEVTGARVDMGPVAVTLEPAVFVAASRDWEFHAADVGNPHAVVFLDGPPADAPVLEVGAFMQSLPHFDDGVNVEFIQVQPDHSLVQRTFERGSGETWACGTGATAAACAAVRLGRVPGPDVTVRLRGGDLRICTTADGAVMEGPARTVFRGEISLSPGP